MSRVPGDAERILELLRLQPNGRLHTARLDTELQLTQPQRTRAIGHLAREGKVISLTVPEGGVRGGTRYTQAVEAFCTVCEGFGELDLVPDEAAPPVGTAPCEACKATGLVPTRLVP